VAPKRPASHADQCPQFGVDRTQRWDVSNLFIIGSSTFPSMSGFNPTPTIEALAFMSADAIVNRYRKSPGPLI